MWKCYILDIFDMHADMKGFYGINVCMLELDAMWFFCEKITQIGGALDSVYAH